MKFKIEFKAKKLLHKLSILAKALIKKKTKYKFKLTSQYNIISSFRRIFNLKNLKAHVIEHKSKNFKMMIRKRTRSLVIKNEIKLLESLKMYQIEI